MQYSPDVDFQVSLKQLPCGQTREYEVLEVFQVRAVSGQEF
jgi:hypothetical protein